MKRIIIAVTAGLLFTIAGVRAQDVPTSGNTKYDEALRLIEQRDTLGLKNLLADWDREDPEYYTVSFNYWLIQAMQDGLELVAGIPSEDDGEALTIYNEGGTDEEPVGYIRPGLGFKAEEAANAEAVIRQGIAKFPDRLDMRFGLAKSFMGQKQWDQALGVFEEVFQRSLVNGCAWLWTLNEPVAGDGKGEDSMLDTFQEYMAEYTEEAPMEAQIALADLFLKYYPEYPVFINDKASLLYSNWQFDDALALMEKAFSLAPDDMLIAVNLAYLSIETNQFEKAQQYADIISLKGDADDKEWAASVKEYVQSSRAEEYRTVDIKELKKYAEKNKKAYEKLLRRFLDDDETLTSEEVFRLYYAAPFAGYGTSTFEMTDFDRYYKEGDAEKAFEVGEKLLAGTCPFSLRLLSRMFSLAYYLGKDPNSYQLRYGQLKDAMFLTGNGHSADCAIAVIDISDEYSLLDTYFGMDEFAGQATLHVDGHDVDEMKYTADSVPYIRYFNVDILFYFYAQMFK